MLNIRRSRDRLIINMGIPIAGKDLDVLNICQWCHEQSTTSAATAYVRPSRPWVTSAIIRIFSIFPSGWYSYNPWWSGLLLVGLLVGDLRSQTEIKEIDEILPRVLKSLQCLWYMFNTENWIRILVFVCQQESLVFEVLQNGYIQLWITSISG